MPNSKASSGANLFRQLSVITNNMEKAQATDQAYQKSKHDLGQWLGETFEVHAGDSFSFSGKLLPSESTYCLDATIKLGDISVKTFGFFTLSTGTSSIVKKKGDLQN